MNDQQRKNARTVGYEFCRGAMTWAGLCVLTFAAVNFAGNAIFGKPLDVTDMSADKRSGVALITDYGTGCQYLKSPEGYLIERRDDRNNHICTGEKK